MFAHACVTLAVLAAPPAVSPATMELVFSLSGRDRARAEAALAAKGPEGVTALVWAARVGGAAGLQPVAAEALQCPNLLARGPGLVAESPGSAAGAALVRLATQDASVRRTLASGPSGLERLVALVASWDDAAGLEALASAPPASWTADELELLNRTQSCQVMSMSRGMAGLRLSTSDGGVPVYTRRGAVLKQLREQGRPQVPPCLDAADADGLAAQATGVRVRGWRSSNREFSVALDLGTGEVAASAACALALYDALKQKGTVASPLLVAVAAHAPAADEAVRRLDADFDALPAKDQQAALRVLIKHGRRVDRLSIFEPWMRARDLDLLEGGLKANDPDAKKHLLSALSCPDSQAAVKLLRLLKDRRQAANEAARIAATCPTGAAAAVALLLDWKDARWSKGLEAAVNDRFGRFELEEALVEHWSPAVKKRLEAVKARDDGTRQWLDGLQQRAAGGARTMPGLGGLPQLPLRPPEE